MAWRAPAPLDPPNIYICIYMYIRVDPCIKCTRRKLATGEVDTAFVDRKVLLSVCCLVLPLVLSSVVLSPLVYSCFLSWLLCSCVLLCRMLGLPWAFFGQTDNRSRFFFENPSTFFSTNRSKKIEIWSKQISIASIS